MIKDSITAYLKDKNSDYAIVMNGEWGCGKTYFIKTTLKEWEEQKTISDLDIVYVSLFGTSSIEDFYKRIYWALHKFQDCFFNKSFAGRFFASSNFNLDLGFLKIASQNGSLQAEANVELPKVISDFGFNSKYSASISKENIDEKSKYELIRLICGEHNRLYIFDDIERISFGDVNVKEIFGAITNLIDEDNAKVLLICNEEKLDKDTHESYSEYKEKFVRHTFKFDPNVEYKNGYDKIYDDFIKDYDLSCFKNDVINIFNKCKYKNLRTLKFIVSTLNKIYESLDCLSEASIEEKKEVMKLLINFIVIYIVEYKDGEHKNQLEDLEDLDFNMALVRPGYQQNEISTFYEIFENIYKEDIKNYHYISSIAEYIKTGTFNKMTFKDEISSLYYNYIRNPNDALLLTSINNYMQLEDWEFKQKVRTFTSAIQNGKYTFEEILVIYNLLLTLKNRGINVDEIDDDLFIEQCKKRIGSRHLIDFDTRYQRREGESLNDKKYNHLLEECKKQSESNKTLNEEDLYNDVYMSIENNDIDKLEYLIQFNYDILLNVNIEDLFNSLDKAKTNTVYKYCVFLLNDTKIDNFSVHVIDDLIEHMTQFIKNHKGSLKTIKMDDTLNKVKEIRNAIKY